LKEGGLDLEVLVVLYVGIIVIVRLIPDRLMKVNIKMEIYMRGKFKRNYRQEPMEAMKVVVHNNDITKALRTLKKKMQNEGIFNELRERTGFKSRGERRRLEKAAGRRRYLRNQKKLKDARGY
jgi:small subunit ribosomal protein S21